MLKSVFTFVGFLALTFVGLLALIFVVSFIASLIYNLTHKDEMDKWTTGEDLHRALRRRWEERH